MKLNKPYLLILSFLGIFIILQSLYKLTLGTWFEQLIIHKITVNSAAILINLITPEVAVVAVNTHLYAAGGGINVLNGCDGLDVMFIFSAAIITARLNIRAKVLGLLIGIPYIFLLNQIRLVGMFYAFRENKALFANVHGTIAPVMIIVFTVIFFSFWISRHSQHSKTQ